MRERVPYADSTERQAVLVANAGRYFIEEQIHADGNFLVFDDVMPEDPQGEFKRLSIAALTPAGVDAYIDTCVTDLASASAVLKLYGKAILWLAKKADLA